MITSNNLSNVTFNGKPLTDVLDKEASNEMHEALSTAVPRISRRSAGSKHKAFTNGISRNLNLPEKDEPDFTQWVLINGVQYLRAAKEPFEKSGFGLKGAQLYDPDSDKVKCNECAEWFINYGGHKKNSPQKHPSAREYKIKHGFMLRTALVGLRFRSLQKAQAKKNNCSKTLQPPTSGHKPLGAGGYRRTSEGLNEKSNCPVQIPVRLRALALQKGRTPTRSEIKSAGISVSAITHIYGSLSKAMNLLGFIPNKGAPLGKRRAILPESTLIDRLVSFRKIRGDWPKGSHLTEANFMPSRKTYNRRFGGLSQAITKAESRLFPKSRNGHIQTSTENGTGSNA